MGNIVFMGMGEPLLNLKAVLPALEGLTDKRRFGVGERNITISTAGITPAIRRLACSDVHPHLALSINSPFDAQRRELMPIAHKYPLSGVLEACKEYAERTRRRVFLEYVLISGLNTSPEAAAELARLARELRTKVNLIAFNPVEGTGLRSPTTKEIQRFRACLEDRGVIVTQRLRRGRDILAGCGQLKGKHRSEQPVRCSS